MADGKLGNKIREWLFSILEALGLDSLVDKEKRRVDDWESIKTLADLERYVKLNPGTSPMLVSLRASQLGATAKDVASITQPAIADAVGDPSAFIGGILQDAAASPMMRELNEIFGAFVFDPYFVELTGGRINPNAPEVEAVRALLGAGTPYAVLGTLLNTIGALTSVGTVQDLGELFMQAGDMLGTPYTAARVITPIVNEVVMGPLQKLVNQTFRTADFTRTQWTDLYALGKIGPARLGEELARQGYTSEKIGWVIDLARTQPSRSDLLAMWRKNIIGPVAFADELRKAGYASEWVERYMDLYADEDTDEDKGAYIGTLRKAFKEQLIGEPELRAALRKQGRSDEAIDLEIAVLRLDQEVAEKTAVKSDIRAAYFEDTIGRPEAANWLAKAGFAAHTIELLLVTWDAQKAPTYKQINKSEILKAWGVSVLSRPEAYQALLDLGYDQRGATVLMQTYEKTAMASKPPATYVLKPSDVMWAWHTEVIEEPEALARLMGAGFTEEDAALVFESFQRLHPRVVATIPRELSKGDILEAFGRMVLTAGETLAKLTDIDYSPEDAAILLEIYQARPEALPPEPTIAELIGACRRGVIDAAILSQKLTALGLRPEDVQFYVTYATAPLPEKTKTLTKTEITKLWSEGRHNRAWALERLLSLNYSPEDAEDLLWLASPDIESTETYVLWSLGVIDSDVAAAMWGSMGFSESDIDRVLSGG